MPVTVSGEATTIATVSTATKEVTTVVVSAGFLVRGRDERLTCFLRRPPRPCELSLLLPLSCQRDML